MSEELNLGLVQSLKEGDIVKGVAAEVLGISQSALVKKLKRFEQ